MDQRQQQLVNWLRTTLRQDEVFIQPVVGDASFRRYFRLRHKGEALIAMDSPPQYENPIPFIKIARAYRQIGLQVPQIFYADEQQGFLLITDFGNQLYHRILNIENADWLYKAAIDELIPLQTCLQIDDFILPLFAEATMMTELNHFTEWFVEKYLTIRLDSSIKVILQKTYQFLINNAISQPQVSVHRDYHSRNLMLLPQNKVGILDFQDAVIGPITYDLVSLIRDCYIDWPLAQVESWIDYYYDKLSINAKLDGIDKELFKRWFDLMGMQRHLKAIFIFARKFLRDNNAFYLQFIPRTLSYVEFVAKKYPELSDFNDLLTQVLLPQWESKKEIA